MKKGGGNTMPKRALIMHPDDNVASISWPVEVADDIGQEKAAVTATAAD